MNNCQSIRHERGIGSGARSSRASGKQKITNGLTALVVDDNPNTLRFAAAMLENLGYNVHMACEGVEALFHLKDWPCELVLTDYQMPAINGFQLGKKVKSNFPGTRVVIMTGLGQAAVTGMMSDDIIDAWLFKPFRMQKLKETLALIGLSSPTEH